jgi:hypothetical protein
MFAIANSLRLFRVMLRIVLLFALASACAAPATQPAAGVTFNLPVPVDMFSSKGTLQVLVWNAGQLAALERQSECVIAHDLQSETDTVLCPEGVLYQEVTPEKFAFPIQGIDHSIQLTSQTVKLGEKYRIALRGLSSDDCNSTSAAAEGTAPPSTITLGNLDWMTTEMACVRP